MDPKTIAALQSTPPPPQRKFQFGSWKAAAARILELETQLGMPRGASIYRIREANLRIVQLENQLSQQPKPGPAKLPSATEFNEAGLDALVNLAKALAPAAAALRAGASFTDRCLASRAGFQIPAKIKPKTFTDRCLEANAKKESKLKNPP